MEPHTPSEFYGSWRSVTRASWVFLLIFLLQIFLISADTNATDAAALQSLGTLWQNEPPNWVGSDPCGDNWVGIKCTNSHIVSITLSSLGLSGTLSGDIASLTDLQTLDLSYNVGLTGTLPSSIGGLSKLVSLTLVGCSFSGEIPPEIGSLQQLVFLSLNSNKFTGSIPATIGYLSKLYWLDLADNELSGPIPVSDGKNPGLDMLKHTKHFHFGMNKLTGTIPSNLFSSDMVLIHVLFDNNQLSGNIPSTLGLVKTLEVIRLDRNSLTEPVPSNINNLTKVSELQLSNNKLIGPLPNLTGMNALTYLDLSNNSFDPSDVPPWFSSLPSLTTLYLEYLRIGGHVLTSLFSSSPLQTVRLRNNRFNGTLDIGTDFSPQLELVDLQNNQIEELTVGRYNKELILVGNPFCDQRGSNYLPCTIPQALAPPYSTPPQNCLPSWCPGGQNLSPKCTCAYPYVGTIYFRAPSFSDQQNTTYFHILEEALLRSFNIHQVPVDSVSLDNASVDSNNYLRMSLQVFPSGKVNFDQSDISIIGFLLSNQTFKPPSIFGPYYFMAKQYTAFQVVQPGRKSNLPLIVGACAGALLLALLLIGLANFAIHRKKRTKEVIQESCSFESWDPTKSSGSAPQLKGARWFSLEEMKKSTNNFSDANHIGFGGYGKVYMGTLGNGQLVAVKRAQQGSTQGGIEFKNEIELLSRVHHKNLVSLVGFCFDQGEQMLVYEYVPNGSLKESLSGKSGVHLDWKGRLRVALGSARGLAYLHELANPPIVHRDVKSSNILLDDHLNAKVSDFGLSKPLVDDSKDHITTQVKGTMGYMDPEYYMTQQLTEKSDVYSFGVVLLELITARTPIEKGRYIVREVRVAMDKMKDLYGLHHLLDPTIGLGTTLSGFEKLVDLAMNCAGESAIDRPTMSEVVKEIEIIIQLAGMNLNAESASTSLSYEGTSKEKAQHPYNKEVFFDYSGEAPSSKLEPK